MKDTVKCRNCELDYNKNEKICPYCGKKRLTFKTILIKAFFYILIAISLMGLLYLTVYVVELIKKPEIEFNDYILATGFLLTLLNLIDKIFPKDNSETKAIIQKIEKIEKEIETINRKIK